MTSDGIGELLTIEGLKTAFNGWWFAELFAQGASTRRNNVSLFFTS